MNSTKTLVAATAIAVAGTAASAASLDFVGGTTVTTVNGYDPSPNVPLQTPLTVYHSATNGGSTGGGLFLTLGAGETAAITYTVMGQESGFFNYANADGTLIGETTYTPVNTGMTGSGYLNFGFATDGFGSPFKTIWNGGTSDLASLYLGFGTIDKTTPNVFSLYAYFDDGVGDFDYDDVVARIDVTATPAPVPLPAAGLLLAGALGGFGALRRRRNAA